MRGNRRRRKAGSRKERLVVKEMDIKELRWRLQSLANMVESERKRAAAEKETKPIGALSAMYEGRELAFELVVDLIQESFGAVIDDEEDSDE